MEKYRFWTSVKRIEDGRKALKGGGHVWKGRGKVASK